jgi:hypothetical protein
MPSQKQNISIGNATRILNVHPIPTIGQNIFFITITVGCKKMGKGNFPDVNWVSLICQLIVCQIFFLNVIEF